MPAPIWQPGTCSVGVRMQRRLFLAAGGALAGFGLWRVRSHAANLDPLADFALTGQLTQGGWARGKAPLDTARLLFGGSISDLSATDALQLGAALASLRGGGGMDPINKLRSAIGLDRLRIVAADPARDQGTGIAAG